MSSNTDSPWDEIANVCSITQLVTASILLAVAICFLVKVGYQKEYMFMIRLLILIIIITVSNISITIVNAVIFKEKLKDTPAVEIALFVLSFLFWMAAYLCVWLVAFKYHEQSQ